MNRTFEQRLDIRARHLNELLRERENLLHTHTDKEIIPTFVKWKVAIVSREFEWQRMSMRLREETIGRHRVLDMRHTAILSLVS